MAEGVNRNTALPVRVRKAKEGDAAGIARVHVDSWRSTYQGMVPDEALARLSYLLREAQWRKTVDDPNRRQYLFVGETEPGEIVGFAFGGTNYSGYTDFGAFLYSLYLLPSHQRQGLGRHLMGALAEAFSRAGVTSLMTSVLKGNPAVHFYETLGGQKLGEEEADLVKFAPDLGQSVIVTEILYGWPDTEAIRIPADG